MKEFDILVDFKGSQDGRFSEDFKAGTRRELSDHLAASIDPAWARPVNTATVASAPATRRGKPAK